MTKRGRWISGLLAFGLVSVLVGIRAIRVDPLDQERSALRKDGFPSTWPEIAALSRQIGADASTKYSSYNEQVASFPNSADATAFNTLQHGSPWSPTRSQEIAAQQLRPYLQQLISASKLPRWSLSEEETSSFKPGGDAHTGIRMLCILAISDAHLKKTNEAFEELEAAARMAAQIYRNPAYSWIGLNREDNVLYALITILKANPNDAALLTKGFNFVKSRPAQPSIRLALYADCVAYLDELDRFSSIHPPSGVDESWIERAKQMWNGPPNRRWAAYTISLRREALEGLTDNVDWKSARNCFRRVEAKHGGDKLMATNSTGMEGVAQSICAAWGANLAVRSVTAAAIDVQLKRIKGTPINLRDYKDPIAGGDLHYTEKGASFVMYSVGMDQADNVGDPIRDIAAGF